MRTPCLLLLAIATASASAQTFPSAREFNENARWVTLEQGVRLYVNRPAAVDPAKPTLLVVYATPNGSTIEQTLGAAKADGVDWRFDIQHVAAQIRRLREVDGRENVVLAVTQAPKLSWPAFRQATPAAPKIIPAVIDEAARGLDVAKSNIVLTGHSGGGSFIFGYLNAFDAIPSSVTRIAFLDANYSYSDDDKHGEKLLAWLKGDRDRHLVVIAYDDRNITLNGKKVVGPTGGTFRATQRMVTYFKTQFDVAESISQPFTVYNAMGGQIEFFVHANPDNKILHTALVGEMNGLLHALTVGTDEENRWGHFGGPRAYEKWISPKPATTQPTTHPTFPAPTIPARIQTAPTGSQFFKIIESLSAAEREQAILHELQNGNVPAFLRKMSPITAEIRTKSGENHAATYFVFPDYLSIGTDDDFFRVPMNPMTAQQIAREFDCALITRKISDEVYRQAALKLSPLPLTKDREAAKTFYQHHRLIEAQRSDAHAPLGVLIAGIKKDVVISNRLLERRGRVAIYGWHQRDGKPIQPLTTVHSESYVDYSHGVRLMSRHVIVDGLAVDVEKVLRNPELSALLSDEGPIDVGAQAPLGVQNR